jgi:hypothetical protein
VSAKGLRYRLAANRIAVPHPRELLYP